MRKLNLIIMLKILCTPIFYNPILSLRAAKALWEIFPISYSELKVCLSLYNSLDKFITQVNRMSRSRRVLAIGGKQRFFGSDMVCIETILFHLEPF